MAAPATQSTSKSSKKKGAAAQITRTESPAPSVASGPADKAGEDDAFQSPFVKELQKNIRNVTKKIANASKTDSLLSQHPDKSLDQLVDARILNNDQKAQILKKPALQAQLNQYEEQLAQYLKVDEQYRTRATAEKANWEKSLQSAKETAVAEAKAEFDKSQRANLLLLSQFLRLAAYRREEGQDPESDESQAIEGVLLAIYTGDDGAVNAMLKLVEGAEESIVSVPGEHLNTTYAAVKTLAQDYKTPLFEGAEPTESDATKDIVTDPTIAHATATEIEAGDGPAVNGQAVEAVADKLANTNVADDAANAVAESHWDQSNEMSISQEWVDVKVPRDPAETETGVTATPAAPSNTQSWADDHPEPVAELPAAAPQAAEANDGFHQVQRNRGRTEREGGNHRGRGRGEWRGRGRGEGRGRGRGGNRGGQQRGPRRTEES